MTRLLLINSPNLYLLATREPGIYGNTNLADVENCLTTLAGNDGHKHDYFQSSAEHRIVDHVQLVATEHIGFLLLNPGALMHPGIAVRDALMAATIQFIEIHPGTYLPGRIFAIRVISAISHKAAFSASRLWL
jgi:3-dehydroquinate dehydratase-2